MQKASWQWISDLPDQAPAGFHDLFLIFQVPENPVQQSVDKDPAFLGAVIFGNFNVFIDGDTGRDGRELDSLRDGHLKDQEIHKSDPFDIPVFGIGFDHLTVFLSVQDGLVEQDPGKFPVLFTPEQR